MKEFKLIKEYPNSPKLDTIVELDSFNATALVGEETFFYGERGNKNIHTNVHMHPEFWQEITKEFEILEIAFEDGGIVDYSSVGSTYRDKQEFIKVFLATENCNYQIYSVRRISDGVVFTLGDSVVRHIYKTCSTPNTTSRIIHKFHITDKGATVEFDTKTVQNFILRLFSHTETPVFRTTDGVSMYEHSKYYVPQVDFNGKLNGSYLKFKVSDGVHKSTISQEGASYSTKQAAMTAIREVLDKETLEKVCLSGQDLIDYLKSQNIELEAINPAFIKFLKTKQ